MKKVVGYPCPKCKKLGEGRIIVNQYVVPNKNLLRFEMDCCHNVLVEFFTDLDKKHYIMEVSNVQNITV